MPNKKKKAPKNAFYFFMREFKEEQEQIGVRFRDGMKEVAEKAGPAWAELHPAERVRFENMAEEAKLKDKSDLTKKFTTLGTSYAMLQQQEWDKRESEKKMLNEIQATVEGLDRQSSLKSYTFYFVHFNHYTQVDNGNYLVCEVAIAQFSLQNGISSVYHTLIRQEKLPCGFTYDAKQRSESTHQIPLPPDLEEGEEFHGTLFYHIKTFLEERSGKMQRKGLPPLYSLDSHVGNAQNALNQLAQYHWPQDPDLFRVYPLSILFYHLRNAASPPGEPAFPVLSIATRELDKDQYNFAPRIACSRHENDDTCVYCSKSIVTRWGYLICDHCCKDLGIRVQRGTHVPYNAAIEPEDDFIEPRRRREKKASSSGQGGRSSSPNHFAPSFGGNLNNASSSYAASLSTSGTKMPPQLQDAFPEVHVTKSGLAEENAHHYNINAASAPVSSPTSSPAGSCWGALTPERKLLRNPKALPTLVQNSIRFTPDDFPSLGSSSKVAAVAGRGRGRARLLEEETIREPGGLAEAYGSVRRADDEIDPGSFAEACTIGPQVAGRGKQRSNKPGSRLAANLLGLEPK